MAMRVMSDLPDRPYVYFGVTDAGAVTTSFNPFSYDPEAYDNPVVLSPNKLVARRWRYRGPALGFVNQAMPLEYATDEYIPMVAPNGTLYVYQPGNDGTWTMALFTADASRRLTTTLMHKGNVAWVADNRFPPVRR